MQVFIICFLIEITSLKTRIFYPARMQKNLLFIIYIMHYNKYCSMLENWNIDFYPFSCNSIWEVGWYCKSRFGNILQGSSLVPWNLSITYAPWNWPLASLLSCSFSAITLARILRTMLQLNGICAMLAWQSGTLVGIAFHLHEKWVCNILSEILLSFVSVYTTNEYNEMLCIQWQWHWETICIITALQFFLMVPHLP